MRELLSDQIWLWARGFEGGGPQAELLRRLAHWLMKEPELETEKLSAAVVEDQMVVTRRTLARDHAAGDPHFAIRQDHATMRWNKIEPGIWRGSVKINELGLYRLTDGILSAVTAAGPLNPKEVADMRATDTVLAPLARASGGSVHWLADGMPAIKRVGANESANGNNWIGLRCNGAYRVTLVDAGAAAAGVALVLIIGTLLLAWRIEGR